ncbi:hypothetical protein A4A49_26629 [Nicotiana attenuata]|uniref:Uncharacterized protein n=1 Tax=Nicotiana attenuata TaxID=49451 RepID=A0A314KXZ8_NICAT|nr:hypothetical protein A4A49_26629 [Nicotiana attenuata]
MIDKGPPKPSRDVPAKTALARIFTVVNPVVQTYDNQKLFKAATGLSTKVQIGDRVEATAEIGNVKDDVVDGNRGSAGVEQSLQVPCGDAVTGKQSIMVVSNLEPTAPLNVISDRAVVVGSTDATGIVGVQDGKEFDRVALVVDEKGQNMVNQAAFATSKAGIVSLEVGARSVKLTNTDCATKGANIKGDNGFSDKGDGYEGLQSSRSNCKDIGLMNVANVWKMERMMMVRNWNWWMERQPQNLEKTVHQLM